MYTLSIEYVWENTPREVKVGLIAGILMGLGTAVIVGYGIYRALEELLDLFPVPVTIGFTILLVGLIVFIVAMIRARVRRARECPDESLADRALEGSDGSLQRGDLR